MKIDEVAKSVKPGRYLLAVSGGVDSICLLQLLSKREDIEITTIHVNHGIRSDDDASKDLEVIESVTNKQNIKLITKALSLGPDASEDQARQARRKVIFNEFRGNGYNNIITAHHKDDVIETIIINLIRGTGRSGLSSLKNDEVFMRPFLKVNKQQILNYAKQNNLVWHEDTTNKDVKYLRNYVRLKLLPKMTKSDASVKDKLFQVYIESIDMNQEINNLLFELVDKLSTEKDSLNRKAIIMLPIEVELAFIHYYLNSQFALSVDSKLLFNFRNFIHTAKVGKKFDLSKQYFAKISNSELSIKKR